MRGSLEEVFDVVADTSREPRYNPRTHHAEQITNGPIGVGTRFHAETARMGRPVDMVIEITDYHLPHRSVDDVLTVNVNHPWPLSVCRASLGGPPFGLS